MRLNVEDRSSQFIAGVYFNDTKCADNVVALDTDEGWVECRVVDGEGECIIDSDGMITVARFDGRVVVLL